jgi:CubicO group peptidase (beta-lactamase class C family)
MKKISFFLFLLFLSIQVYAQRPLDTLSLLKNNPNVYSIIFTKNDRVIYKNYFNHYNSKSLFNDQSLTKNIVSLLVGIAINKGYIKSVDENISDFFPELKKDTDKRKQDITIREVMNQASGLYHENLMNLGDYLKIPDPSEYVLKAPMISNPGEIWHYNNAATHLISVIISKSTGMETQQFA